MTIEEKLSNAMNQKLFKGAVPTKNKKAVIEFKDKPSDQLLTITQADPMPEFGLIMDSDTVLIDIDDSDQAEILMNIAEGEVLDCLVWNTTRGKHFFFQNDEIEKNGTHKILACGLTADIKLGSRNSYAIYKFGGVERHIEWDIEEGLQYQRIPKWLTPIVGKADFLNMEAGDGRNQSFYNYILTLQSNGFTVEESRETIRIINQYVLQDPLSERELDVILRDEAFLKPVFHQKNKFIHNIFGEYLMRQENVVMINKNLHIYNGGIYSDEIRLIIAAMIKHIPTISKVHRNETLSYIEAMAEEVCFSSVSKIPMKNGLYNLDTDMLEDFTPSFISKNKIPTAYNPAASSPIMDKFLDDLSCGDPSIRAVIEEMVGISLHRSADYDAFFILVGDGSNGKSTLLELMIEMLGQENVSSVELKDLEKTFKTAELFGKLVNIGDDISSNDIKNSSFIKKLASGNQINVERKGKNPFEMKSYAKMIFSSNTTPIIHDTTHGLNRRLILIPLNNKFEHDIGFKSKIMTSENLEYLLKVGIQGLKRVLKNNGKFTSSKAIEKAGSDYQKLNNPVLAYLDETDHDSILNEHTEAVFLRFQVWCSMNNQKYDHQQTKFTSEVKKVTGFETAQIRVPKDKRQFGKSDRCWVYVTSNKTA